MTQTSHVVVVGAGVIGCSVAYELARRGVRVEVIDCRDVGQGATQASAGVLAPFVEAHAGSPVLDLGARSLDLYDEFVARVVEDSGSTVQYLRTGTLEVATDDAFLARLRDLGKVYRANGVEVEYLDAKAIRAVEPQLSENVLGGLLVRTHGFVGATDLTHALWRAACVHGVTFVTSVSATKVSKLSDGLRVETGVSDFSCDAVVLAAGSWSGQVEIEDAEPTPVRPIRGQLLHLGWPAPPLTRVVWARRCYLVPWTDGSVLVGATMEDVGFDEAGDGKRHPGVAPDDPGDRADVRSGVVQRGAGRTASSDAGRPTGHRPVGKGARVDLCHGSFPQRHSARTADGVDRRRLVGRAPTGPRTRDHVAASFQPNAQPSDR